MYPESSARKRIESKFMFRKIFEEYLSTLTIWWIIFLIFKITSSNRYSTRLPPHLRRRLNPFLYLTYQFHSKSLRSCSSTAAILFRFHTEHKIYFVDLDSFYFCFFTDLRKWAGEDNPQEWDFIRLDQSYWIIIIFCSSPLYFSMWRMRNLTREH